MLGGGAWAPGTRNWLDGSTAIGGPAWPMCISSRWSNLSPALCTAETETCLVHPRQPARADSRRCLQDSWMFKFKQQQRAAMPARQRADCAHPSLISVVMPCRASLQEYGRMIAVPLLLAASSSRDTLEETARPLPVRWVATWLLCMRIAAETGCGS